MTMAMAMTMLYQRRTSSTAKLLGPCRGRRSQPHADVVAKLLDEVVPPNLPLVGGTHVLLQLLDLHLRLAEFFLDLGALGVVPLLGSVALLLKLVEHVLRQVRL